MAGLGKEVKKAVSGGTKGGKGTGPKKGTKGKKGGATSKKGGSPVEKAAKKILK